MAQLKFLTIFGIGQKLQKMTMTEKINNMKTANDMTENGLKCF